MSANNRNLLMHDKNKNQVRKYKFNYIHFEQFTDGMRCVRACAVLGMEPFRDGAKLIQDLFRILFPFLCS